MRFTRQQPQYDQFLQMTNFFPNEWSRRPRRSSTCRAATAARSACTGNARNAMNPRTGAILTAPGALNTAAAIGTVIPNSGNLTERHQGGRSGHFDVRRYDWPTIVYGPRVGAAFDLHGRPEHGRPRRRGPLLRPSGRQHGVLDSRATRPIAESQIAEQQPAADARPGPEHGGYVEPGGLPVRREDAVVGAVERGRADGAAVGVVARRLLRRQLRVQPVGRPAGRQPGQPELHRPRARPTWPQNQDPTRGDQRDAGRGGARQQPAACRSAASAASGSTRRSSTTSTTRSSRRSTAGSAVACRSV